MADSNALTAAATQRATTLIDEIKRQSQPRRWPWQEKTVRDLINEGRSELVDRALERSNKLTSAAAEQRDELLSTFQRQSQPRRWFWQEKTAYDKFGEQRARIADSAIERATALAELANERRQYLVEEARRQSQPRRFFWEAPTLRDKIESKPVGLRTQLQPSRWPWQEPTLRDKLEDRREELRAALADTLPAVQGSAEEALARASLTARRTGQAIAATPQRIGSLASSTAGTLVDSGQGLATRVGDTAESAASSIKAAAMVPVDAVSGTVAASRRGVRRSMRLFRTLIWGILIGAAIGIVLAPRAGQETRRNLQDLWERVMELIPASS